MCVLREIWNKCDLYMYRANLNVNLYMYRANLDVGDRDVEELVHICEPDHSHICHNHCPQISLVTEQDTIMNCSFSLNFEIRIMKIL